MVSKELKLQLIKVSECRTVPATLPEEVPLTSMGASVVGCSGCGSEVKTSTHCTRCTPSLINDLRMTYDLSQPNCQGYIRRLEYL